MKFKDSFMYLYAMLSKHKFLQVVLSFTFILSISGFESQTTAFNICLPNTTWITADKGQVINVDVYRISSHTSLSFSVGSFATFNFKQFLKNQEDQIFTQNKTFTSLYLPKYLDVNAFVQKPSLPEPANLIV